MAFFIGFGMEFEPIWMQGSGGGLLDSLIRLRFPAIPKEWLFSFSWKCWDLTFLKRSLFGCVWESVKMSHVAQKWPWQKSNDPLMAETYFPWKRIHKIFTKVWQQNDAIWRKNKKCFTNVMPGWYSNRGFRIKRTIPNCAGIGACFGYSRFFRI